MFVSEEYKQVNKLEKRQQCLFVQILLLELFNLVMRGVSRYGEHTFPIGCLFPAFKDIRQGQGALLALASC